MARSARTVLADTIALLGAAPSVTMRYQLQMNTHRLARPLRDRIATPRTSDLSKDELDGEYSFATGSAWSPMEPLQVERWCLTYESAPHLNGQHAARTHS